MGQSYSPSTGITDRNDFLAYLTWAVNSNRLEKVKRRNKPSLYNLPAGFDIETSSFYANGIKNPLNKRAIMYHWQFGIGNKVTTGRTWSEFRGFCYAVASTLQTSSKLILPVYVHNLPYEWGFMRKWLEWNFDKVFLLERKKPVYALALNGLEFRDSAVLWGYKSLASVGKDLRRYPVDKMIGDLDYNQIRTPLTPLTEKELKYCENDIRIILHGIQEEIEDNGGIDKLPLTNTQRVRIYSRNACIGGRNEKSREYRDFIRNLTLDMQEYRQLKKAFQGGFVHANANYVDNYDEDISGEYHGKIVSMVSSNDFASKYPSVMVLRKFPMSRSTRIDRPMTNAEFEYYLNTKCCLFDLKIGCDPVTGIGGVRPRTNIENIWSASKCHPHSLVEPITNNGRIVECKSMKITVTELDYEVLNQYYEWDYEEVSNFRWYEKQYLPIEIVNVVLDLYERKTKLKGIHEELINYMVSKNMLNSMYGMMVTDFFKDEYVYTAEHEYAKLRVEQKKSLDEYCQEVLRIYNQSKNRFLFYPWGVWITAWARYDLLMSILEVGGDYVYSDTDCIKCRNYEKHKDFFQRYNDGIMEEIKEVSERRGIPIERFSPMGKTIGVWEYEGTYNLFKTMGAKRYMTMKTGGYAKWTKKANKRYKLSGGVYSNRHRKLLKRQISKNKYNRSMLRISGIPDDVVIDRYGNEWEITTAGLKKFSSMQYLVDNYEFPMDVFIDGMTIPAEYSGRLIRTYIDFETKGSIVDINGVSYDYYEKSSIHMENSEYTMKLGDDYRDFLFGYIKEVDYGEEKDLL